MEDSSNQQLLKRIASLVSENKELKNKQRILTETNNRLINELKECHDLIEKARHEYIAMTDNVYQQKRFETVTVLYVDIGLVSGTDASSNSSEYIDKVYHFMRLFRKIAKKYSLIKIHSIGAHFIYAGGIPEKNFINPVTVTLAAFEMVSVFETDTFNNDILKLSIGIHTGGVTALVDGKHTRLSYFESESDTVYETSRIVALCKDNKLTLSATTYELVKELFDCQYNNNLLPVKNNKKLELFNTNGIKSEYAADEKRYFPNHQFRTQLMLIQFRDLQEVILDKLEKELPSHLYYHNVKHTVDVVTQCELIGWAEGLDDHQLLMLKTAALFHDAGHTISYSNHEARSIDIAREMLPKYDYLPEEIEMIVRLIMATKLPPKPYDLLESIICDSDLDYLGRIDFVPVSNTLFAELQVQNKTLTLNDWNMMQIKFISSHQYFTDTGRRLRNVKKQEQIERIKQLIED